jgi:PIN domain nuclease of toxin-antitoxin system
MRLLLDTHILVWLARAPELLSAGEIARLDRVSEPPMVSALSLWELRIKWEKRHPSGARKGVLGPDEAIDYVGQTGLTLVPLAPEQCVASLEPPFDHGDPFDTMLLVQASQLGARLLTRDRNLIGHPLAIGG